MRSQFHEAHLANMRAVDGKLSHVSIERTKSCSVASGLTTKSCKGLSARRWATIVAWQGVDREYLLASANAQFLAVVCATATRSGLKRRLASTNLQRQSPHGADAGAEGVLFDAKLLQQADI